MLNNDNSPSTSGTSGPLHPAIFPHRCPSCSIAFRHPDQLQAHSLAHSPAKFRLWHRCAQCPSASGTDHDTVFPSRKALNRHRAERHQGTVQNGQQENASGNGGGGHFCDICADGQRFDTDQALMAHFNSEQHLCRSRCTEQHNGTLPRLASSASTPQPTPSSSSSSSSSSATSRAPKRPSSASTSSAPKHLPYKCNVCSLSFGQPGTLDTHLRSMAHAQRMAKLAELVQSGELDPGKPVFEQPEPHPPQRSIGEVAAERRSKTQMGKLAGAVHQPPPPQPQLQAVQQHNPFMNNLMATSSNGGSSTVASFGELFKPLLLGNNDNPLVAQQQQQQQLLAAQLMAQMFAASMQPPAPDATATLMATAQMAAQMAASASGNNSFNFLDLFGGVGTKSDPDPNPSPEEEPRGLDTPNPNIHGPRASAPPPRGQPEATSADDGAPRAKRARADSTPAAPQPRGAAPGWPQIANGHTDSREGSVAADSASTPSALTPSAGAVDLAAVLQALASGQPVPAPGSTSAPFAAFSPSPDPAGGILMAPPAASANKANNRSNDAPSPQSPQKRARTRIGDDQVKILRQYFDINNSPSEEQIKEMARKAQLPEKVIKHWFRNTLFKERQRDKDSPYNFAIPPMLGIDLATYHRTGEARIIPAGAAKAEDDDERSKINDQRLAEAEEREKTTVKEEAEEKQTDGRDNVPDEETADEKEEEERPRMKDDEEEEAEESGSGRDEEEESASARAADFLAAIAKQPPAPQGMLPPAPFPSFFGAAGTTATAGNPMDPFASMLSAAFPFHSLAQQLAAGGSNGFLPPPLSSASAFRSPPATAHPFNAFPPLGASSNPPSSSASLAPPGTTSSTISSVSAGINTTTTASMGGSGRRANRTRFTDFQLRTLQQFFDKQAYPKDDDLEMLSKKMGLSPRVIVVWFQNARQKARKVFEQQPQLLAVHAAHQQQMVAAGANDDGSGTKGGFQCARCPQAFSKYMELIQHQHQRACHAGENHEQPRRVAEDDAFGGRGWAAENDDPMRARRASSASNTTTGTAAATLMMEQSTQELLRALVAQQHNSMGAEIKAEALRHPEQTTDADAAPEAKTTSAAAEPLDLSVSSTSGGVAFGTQQNNVDQKDNEGCWLSLGSRRSCEASSLSPTAFSMSDGGGGEYASQSRTCSPSSSSAALLSSLFQPSATATLGCERSRNQQQLSPASGTQASGGGGSKRFRTHLTPMQVFIMKSLFNDYKTPSMQECDALGQRIGLHKRVVQVWFQNARAKERKCGAGGGSAGSGAESSSDDSAAAIPHCGPPNTHHCALCDGVEFASLQDHIFSAQHIARVRERGAQMRCGTAGSGNGATVTGGADNDHDDGSTSVKRAKRESASSGGEAGADNRETETAKDNENGEDVDDQQQATDLAAMAALAAQQQFPYGLMYAAAAASGMPTGTLPPLLYDPGLFGTPVPALKIPKGVQLQIMADMAQRRERTRFTQDGLELAELADKCAEEDFRHADTVDLEVGWGCPQCGNVFQQPEQLQNHQKLICAAGTDGADTDGNSAVFRLVQTHYRCMRCAERFGTQDEFLAHCQTDAHNKFKQELENNNHHDHNNCVA